MDMKQLGRRIRSARKERNLTLENVSIAVGVDHSQISRIERGENSKISKNVQKICDFLHIFESEQDSLAIGKAGVKMRR